MAFISRYPRIYIVEQNRDAQLRMLLKMEIPGELISRLRSVLHYNGLPIDARSVTDDILVQEGKKARATARPEVTAGVTAGAGE